MPATTRRRVLQSAAGLTLLTRRAPAAVAPRNTLFLAIDDLNDWIGCLGGYPNSHTPNLDRLAAQGVLFTNAHCAAPLCNPSRASIMTGVRPSTSGVYDNNQPYRQSPALAGALTLPQHLRTHGYRALGAGKIFHNAFPDPKSWDDYWPSQTRTMPSSPEPAAKPAHGIPNSGNFDWGALDVTDEEMGDTQVASWISQHLAKKTTDPLFLACGIFRPHLPWYIPRKYIDAIPLSSIELPSVKADDLDDVPPIGRRFALALGDHPRITGAGKWKEAVRHYLASIAFADATLGRVLRALETGPNAGGFSIVLWSDHGWHLGEKLHWRKFTLWEESTRSVLMAAIPGVTKPKGRCPRGVSLLDLYATLTDTHGLPRPTTVEGTSLLPQLRDPMAKRAEPALTTFGRGNHSIRDERWRYIRYSDGGEELYDRSQDPMEWSNLASKPAHASTKAQLARWLPKTDAADVPPTRAGGE